MQYAVFPYNNFSPVPGITDGGIFNYDINPCQGSNNSIAMAGYLLGDDEETPEEPGVAHGGTPRTFISDWIDTMETKYAGLPMWAWVMFGAGAMIAAKKFL